jgi:sec-independent protein translocase protein TatB
MLDIGWWELFVVGMVALVVVGPRELPTLLRTIGRYVGMAKRQADEFRSQFDDAIRESEFNDLRDEINDIKSGVTTSLDDAQDSINKELRDEHDWDKDGPIEPAPEYANAPPTTSFTTADGEVIQKTAEDGGNPNDVPDAGVIPAADTAGAAQAEPAGVANGTASDATTTTTDDATDNKAPRPSDAEAVR